VSDQLTKESDNDTQCELAAWELLKEAREERDKAQALARELRDAITPFIGLNPSSPRVKAKWPDFVERANAALIKAKEVLP
jgi:PleD family two-component response regulator